MSGTLIFRVLPMKLITVATCNLAQWALDFEGNFARIAESIREAKRRGYRVGPELEVSGYGCEDHFLEGDTFLHCWEVIVRILESDLTDDILCDIGMPVLHRNVRVFLLNRRVVFIRPKLALANDGNYREGRWFVAWTHRFQLHDYYLPHMVGKITGQKKVPFGDGCIALADTVLGCETCEELWTPESPHIPLSLDGVEIISNGSGSHHQLRKLNTRLDLIKSATSKAGGIYLYANHQCCDGGRIYFDGCCLVSQDGKIYAQGTQFSMNDVEVVTATLDLIATRVYRASINSRNIQASRATTVPRVDCNFHLSTPGVPSKPIEAKIHDPMEEIAFGPACWMWDYLRRSGLPGFFLPLSGGADSSATCAMVGIMCKLVFKTINEGNTTVLNDARRIAGYGPDEGPASAEELCSRIFVTCYMGTVNSSEETRDRAKLLAEQVGSHHISLEIDPITRGLLEVFQNTFQKELKFKAHGGSETENIALQNIQARSRMVLAYFLAQTYLWTQGRSGTLLVLGSANVQEALRGYMTKYDCSSADINPIGGISKLDLRAFLNWAANSPFVHYPCLDSVATATPTAELEPSTGGHVQTDEEDMGMTYQDLEVFGRLRKCEHCGPYSMFSKLVYEMDAPPEEVADKVKRFFRFYAINRHKMTVLTPAYHAENYSPDDNRFDLRPFLYNTRWPWQFQKIDQAVEQLKEKASPPQTSEKKRKREESDDEDEEELENLLKRVGELTEKMQRKRQKTRETI